VRTQSADTPPEVEEVLLDLLRRMSPEQRLQRMYELTATARALAAGRVRRQYGEQLEEHEVALRLGALVIDRQLMIEAFDWDGEARGW
jgi:hypothetical protein